MKRVVRRTSDLDLKTTDPGFVERPSEVVVEMSPQHDVEATVTLVAEHEADIVVAARTVDEPRARVVDVSVESLA